MDEVNERGVGPQETRGRIVSARAPLVRLDAQLVSELPDVPSFQSIIASVHELVDFFQMAAEDSFSVPAPDELHKRGMGGTAIARSKLLFFNRLVYLRTAELLPAAVRAINESRLVTFALATRGILETAAVAAYHAQSLAIEEGVMALPDDYADRLRAAVLSGRFDWRRFLSDPAARLAHIEAYDRDPDNQEPEGAAKNVVTMVDKLGRRLGKTIPKARGMVRFDYALLSDMCHPSAGSNMIYLADSSPRMRAELVPQRVTLLGVVTMLLPCLEYSARAVVDLLAELEVLDQRLAKMPATAPSPPSGETAGA